jgi:hypothetical protein
VQFNSYWHCPFFNVIKGYVIYSIRKKLKKQYAHLKGTQIEKLKQSGAEVRNDILLNCLHLIRKVLAWYSLRDLILDYRYHTVPRSCLHGGY